jgi:2-keto-4-pentenoate hydratase/2-oxohepta-3-ene-1,7-dioic acid hydratase in catechol pathway
MTEYRLMSYQSPLGPRAGLVVGERVHDAAEVSGREDFRTVLSIISGWQHNESILVSLAKACVGRPGVPMHEVAFLAPILYPPAVYCAGANYTDHVANMERKLGLEPAPDPHTNGGKPFHFHKAAYCCVGHRATVRRPSMRLDWEGELVAVIGVMARHISVTNALDYVAGYMVGNDLSARDQAFRPELPRASIFHHSWIDHKSFEDSAPVGPWMVPASDITDPSTLRIRTAVNGMIKQDGHTSNMIFSLQEQIAYLSSIITLRPGDIIMTGTPAGVGAETDEFLNPGDTVTVEIDQLGTLTTLIA